MAFTLKTVLDGEGSSDLTMGLSMAHTLLNAQIMSQKSKADIKQFEKRLNQVFYPNETEGGISANSALEFYQSAIKERDLEYITEVFNSFDFEGNKSGYYGQKGKGVQYRSLNNIVLDLKRELETFKDTDIKGFEEKFNKVNAKVKEADSLLKSSMEVYQIKGISNYSQKIVGNNPNEIQRAIELTNQLDAFYTAIHYGVTPQTAGLVFEKALEKANWYMDATEDTLNEIVEKIGLGIGQKTIRRDVGGIQLNEKISALNTSGSKGIAKNFTIAEDRIKATYSYDPGEKKQGKMDVQMTFGGGPLSDYRISAKRWSRGHGNFGETTIDAGLVRTGGYGVAEAYKMAVLTPSKDTYGDGSVPAFTAASKAHEFAKKALKADILMGTGQIVEGNLGGYANLLVIDTGRRIHVRNLADLVFNDKVKLTGYNEGDIQSEAISSYYSLPSRHRTITYLKLMTSWLNQQKVSINYSVLGK